MKIRLLLMSVLAFVALAVTAAETPPVTLSCTSQSAFNEWTVINATSRGWKYSSSKGAAESWGSSSAENDYWLVSVPVQLEAGIKYDVTYNVASESATASHNVKFTVGQGNTAADQTHILFSSTSFSPGRTYTDYSYEFVPEATGEYNFAIWNGSTSTNSVCLKYIKVEAQVPLPAAVTDLSVVTDAGGALGATLSWTWPATTYKGQPLTSIKGAKIYRTNSSWGSATESNLIATVDFENAQPGASATWHDGTLTTAGNYYYFVKPYNEYGDSPASAAASGKTDWLGSDTPAAFTPTTTLGSDGATVVLAWTVAGKNGGIVDPSQVTYKIERTGSLTGTVTLETAWQGDQPYTDLLPSYDKYQYKVYATCNGITSTANSTLAFKGGPAIEIPYSEDFTTSSHGDVWTFVSNISRNWTVSSYHLDFWASKDNQVNAWAITPPLSLKAGKAYRLAFEANKQSSASEVRNLKVAVADAATLDAMDAATPLLIDVFNVAVTPYEKIVTVNADGTYYIGFNISYTSTNSNDAYIDNISLEEVAMAPAPIADLAITPDAHGALSATVSWTNPTLTNTGAPLQALDKVELYLGSELLQTYTNPAPGATMTAEQTYTEPGTYTYSAVAYLGENASEKAEATSPWVGIDTPAAPAGVALTRHDDGSALLTWSPATGLQGGYLGAVTYTVTCLTDNSEVASALADTLLQIPAQEALALYSYSVAATNQRGTGSAATSNAVILGKGIALPYQATLDSNALALWTLPASESGKAWKYDSGKGGLYSGFSSDLWAFTPPLMAQKGTIKVAFTAKAYSSRYPEDLEVGLYSVAEIGAEPIKVEAVNVANSWDNAFELEYTVPKVGIYYIGYHVVTSDPWGCTITKTEIEQTTAILPTEPAAITDLTLTPGENGANAATLAWTYPTLSVSDDTLETIDSVAVLRNGEQIALLGSAAPGAKATYSDAVDAAGLYSYAVVTYANSLPSQAATSDTLWIGRDQIAPVASATLTANAESGLSIAFASVTAGIHGGYIPTDSVSYVIVSGITGEAVDTVATSPATLPYPQAYNYYSYSVIAAIGSEKATAVNTNALLCGVSVALPYSNTFTSAADSAVMQTPANAEGKAWKFVEKDGDHYRFFKAAVGAELITPHFAAQAGTVTVSAMARCFGALYPETFAVKLYADGSDEPVATDTIVATGAGFVSYLPATFQVDADGVYRAAFSLESISIEAYIDGIEIEQTNRTVDEVSLPVTELTATAAGFGEQRATVACNVPTHNTFGLPIHHLAAIEIWRDTTLVATISEPNLGSRVAVTDTEIAEPGFYTYTAVALTDNHASDSVTVTSDWVGLDTATAPTLTLVANPEGGALLTISHGERGINGGYIGQAYSRIYSNIDGLLTESTTETEITIPEPESLDVFYFTVWAFGDNQVESEPATSRRLALGEALLLPHTFDFTRPEIFVLWGQGSWTYDGESQALVTDKPATLLSPGFYAKEDSVVLHLEVTEQATLECTLLNQQNQAVSVPIYVTPDENGYGLATFDLPEHEGTGIYRLSIKSDGAATIYGASISEHKKDEQDGVSSIQSASLAYDPATATLTATGTTRVYTTSGMLVHSLEANGSVSLASLPAGAYIVTCGTKSIKIIK